MSNRAGMRWPFELVQNAHDAGPRSADSLVDIEFKQQGDDLVVDHYGKPFVADELAALLSGGSSKEYGAQDTTGRFGTGFLSTHALSTRVDVEGILSTPEGAETFRLSLDRGGNEESIISNIGDANSALEAAKQVPNIGDRPTARFTYYNANAEVVRDGLDRLELALPYLYSTCDKLGQIMIQRLQNTVRSNRLDVSEGTCGEFLSRSTVVEIQEAGHARRRYTAVRICGSDSVVGLLMALKHEGSQREVLIPPAFFPRIFVSFPIGGTDVLPFNVLLDGRFTPQQERDGIAMNDNDKSLINIALSTLPTLVEHAVRSGWQGSHKLARIEVPSRALADDASSSAELDWWREVISKVSRETAMRPIVRTDSGLLPALSGGNETSASFLVPATDKTGRTPLDYRQLYRIGARILNLQLPQESIAQDWAVTISGWQGAELPIARLGLADLAIWVRSDCRTIQDLPIRGDPFRWLGDLFLVVAGLPDDVDERPLLSGLVPDQHSRLHDGRSIRIDKGIDEEVKIIADGVGIDLRAKLVHQNLMATLEVPDYEPARQLIASFLGDEYPEDEAIDNVLARLDHVLADDHGLSEGADMLRLHAATRLIAYLSRDGDGPRLRRCPVVTLDGKIDRLEGKQILAPVEHWPETARPYAGLYGESRILSERYIVDEALNPALKPLIEGDLALPAPIYWSRRSEISGALLRAMTPEDVETRDLTIRNQRFGQIAFLSSDVLNRCGHNKGLARKLLEFVLTVAVKEDPDWINTRALTVSDGARLDVHGSTWPFELEIRPWVPFALEDGDAPAPTMAREATLDALIDQEWLRDNPSAVSLLEQVFGFSSITLMRLVTDVDTVGGLVRLAQYPDLVKSVAENVEVVNAMVSDPDALELLAEASPNEIKQMRAEIKKQRYKDEVRERNRNFGQVVQEAIREAVTLHGLVLRRRDLGYDYEVFPPDGSSFSFEVGAQPHFLEVKATVSRDVRLTPRQAETASDYPDRFVLCVVDLSDLGDDAYSKSEWEAADIVRSTKIVTNIGARFSEVCNSIATFTKGGRSVRLWNEGQLRYGVSEELWSQGISIEAWARSLRD